MRSAALAECLVDLGTSHAHAGGPVSQPEGLCTWRSWTAYSEFHSEWNGPLSWMAAASFMQFCTLEFATLALRCVYRGFTSSTSYTPCEPTFSNRMLLIISTKPASSGSPETQEWRGRINRDKKDVLSSSSLLLLYIQKFRESTRIVLSKRNVIHVFELRTRASRMLRSFIFRFLNLS